MCGCRARGVSEEGETSKRATHDDSAARDGGLDERVQLLVAADGQLQVARRDALHLQVLGRVASQLQHLGGEVLCSRRHVSKASEQARGNESKRELRVQGAAAGAPRMAAAYTAAVAPTRPPTEARVWAQEGRESREP